MESKTNICWNYGMTVYRKGTFLLGLNFNTNTDLGEREAYLIIYLGTFSLMIGRFS